MTEPETPGDPLEIDPPIDPGIPAPHDPPQDPDPPELSPPGSGREYPPDPPMPEE